MTQGGGRPVCKHLCHRLICLISLICRLPLHGLRLYLVWLLSCTFGYNRSDDYFVSFLFSCTGVNGHPIHAAPRLTHVEPHTILSASTVALALTVPVGTLCHLRCLCRGFFLLLGLLLSNLTLYTPVDVDARSKGEECDYERTDRVRDMWQRRLGRGGISKVEDSRQ